MSEVHSDSAGGNPVGYGVSARAVRNTGKSAHEPWVMSQTPALTPVLPRRTFLATETDGTGRLKWAVVHWPVRCSLFAAVSEGEAARRMPIPTGFVVNRQEGES